MAIDLGVTFDCMVKLPTDLWPKGVKQENLTGKALIGTRTNGQLQMMPVFGINHNRFRDIGTAEEIVDKSLKFDIPATEMNSCAIDSFTDLMQMTVMQDVDMNAELGSLLHCLVENRNTRVTVLNELKEKVNSCSSAYEKSRLYRIARMKVSKDMHAVWDLAIQHYKDDFDPKGRPDATPMRLPEMLIETEYGQNKFGLRIERKCDVCTLETSTTNAMLPVTNEAGSHPVSFQDQVDKGIEMLYKEERCSLCSGSLSLMKLETGKFVIVDCNILENPKKLDEYVKVNGKEYKVKGLIKHGGNHFVSVVKLMEGYWAILNDLRDRAYYRESVDDCLEELRNNSEKCLACRSKGDKCSHVGSNLIGVCMLILEISNEEQQSNSGHENQLEVEQPEVLENGTQNVRNIVTSPTRVAKNIEETKEEQKRRLARERQRKRRQTMQAKEKEKEKQENVKRLQELRAKQTAEEKEKEKQEDARRRQELRAKQTAEDKEKEKQETARRMQELRAKQTVEEKEKEKQEDARRRQELRAKQTAKEKQKEKQEDARRRQELRAKQTAKEKQKEKQEDARRRQELRAKQTAKEKQKEKQEDARRRQELRAKQTTKEKQKEKQENVKRLQELRAKQTTKEKQKEKQENVKRLQELRAKQTTEEKKKEKQEDARRRQELRSRLTNAEMEYERHETARRIKELRATQTSKEKEREKCNLSQRMKKLRADFIDKKREKQKEAAATAMRKQRSSQKAAADIYEQSISQKLEKICASCKRLLWFDQSYSLQVANDITEQLMLNTGDLLCYLCKKSIQDEEVPIKCYLNNLRLNRIPGVLAALNFLERRFICQVQTYMTLLRLPGEGQYAQDGLAIHFASEPEEIVKILPHGLDSSGIVCIAGKSQDYIRPAGIFAALEWLKRHNWLYRDVDIDYNELEICPSAVENILDEINQTGSIPIDYESPNMKVGEFLKRTGMKVDFPRSECAPVSFADRKFAECMAFPWLFPRGQGDFDAQRDKKITLLQYLHSRILHEDSRFRCDIPYLIVATNRYERQVLQKLVSFYVARVRKTVRGSATNTMPLTLGDVQGLTTNPDLASNSMMFTKQIRGTSSYWKDKLWDLLAKMKCLGPPDIFLTLSCADLQWPELEELLRDDLGSKFTTVAQAVKTDPVIVALYTDKRFREFLKYLKRSKVLGDIIDYHARVEFQKRGSVHFHLFLWIRDCPSLHKDSSNDELIAYIDEKISTQWPSNANERELVKLQVHNHTTTCRLKKNRCRFHYPRRLCDRTRILYTDQRNNSLGNFYETARDEGAEMINPYNMEILKHWRANMDIQLVNGEKGLAWYVLKYAMKAEPDELKSKVAQTLQNMETANDLNQHGRMMMLGMCQLKCRQLSAQEAAYRICDIDMIYSNRQVKRISTLRPEKRMKRLNPEKLAMKSAEVENDMAAQIDDCFDDNIIDIYRKRPVTLKHHSLHEFASWYEKRPIAYNNTLVLLDGSGSLHKRTKPLCLRTSNLSTNTDDYYYSLLLLYLPHRAENELLGDYSSAQEAFLKNEEQLNQAALHSEQAMHELVATAQRLRTSMVLLEQLAESNDERTAESETESSGDEFGAMAQESMECDVQLSRDPPCWTRNEESQWQSLTTGELSPDVFRQKLTALSNDQRRVLKYLHKKLYRSQNNEQIMLFLTGNAGTGKSWLLELVIEWLRLTRGRYPGHDSVAIAAPSGLAAKNIGGVTLHSLLKLPVQHDGSEPQKIALKDMTKQNLKKNLKDKDFLVVDEVSMLGNKMLVFVNDRLQEIFDKSKPFGGIHIIFCGDFFQLPPVHDLYCFHNILFADFDVIILEENMRQKEDRAWCKLLDKIRIGTAITPKEREMLDSRVFPTEALYNTQTDLRLYPTRKRVKEYNEAQQKHLEETEYSDIADPTQIVTIIAQDVYSNNDTASGCTAEPKDIPEDDRKAGGLYQDLSLSVNSRIMCVKNLGGGIINGSMGKVHSFEFNKKLDVIAVFIDFDDKDCGAMFRDPNRDNAVRIDRYSQEFHHGGRFINRSQFPIIPAWAVTIHKGQGLSLDSAVVDIGSAIFEHGQIYVALSRVRNLNGLYIEGGFKFTRWWQPKQEVLNYYLGARTKYAELKKELAHYKVKQFY